MGRDGELERERERERNGKRIMKYSEKRKMNRE